MSSVVREQFRMAPMATNAAERVGGPRLGAFLAKTAGTITVTDADSTVLVDAVPVAAGQFTPIPGMFRTGAGGTVTLAGGASGTLFV
jgi:hypothetical protein